jgi:hypothetical protein
MGNFLTANIAGLESMQEGDIVHGYQYNRIVAVLNGLNPLNITAGAFTATTGSFSGDLNVLGRIVAGVDPTGGAPGSLISNTGGATPGTGIVYFGNAAGLHYLYYNGAATQFQLTDNLDLNTHALTSITTITTSGAINGQTISSAANFTGTLHAVGVITADTGVRLGANSPGSVANIHSDSSQVYVEATTDHIFLRPMAGSTTGQFDVGPAGHVLFAAHLSSGASGTPTTTALGANITSVTFTGNDIRGKIVIVVGAGGLAANTRIATCTYAVTYAATVFPDLINQTSGAGLAVVNFYSSAESATAFDLFCNQALVVGTYTIRYTVIG